MNRVRLFCAECGREVGRDLTISPDGRVWHATCFQGHARRTPPLARVAIIAGITLVSVVFLVGVIAGIAASF